MNWGLTDEDIAHMPASVQRSFSRSLIDPAHKPPRYGLGADLGSGMGRALVAGECEQHPLFFLAPFSTNTPPSRAPKHAPGTPLPGRY